MINIEGEKFYFVDGEIGTATDLCFTIARPVLQYTAEDKLELGATFLGFKIVSFNMATGVFVAVSPDGFWVNLARGLSSSHALQRN